MPIPKCKIQTLTGTTQDYEITDDLVNVHVKDVLNGVGTFNFVLPTVKGTTSQSYLYTDIAINDYAKIYFWDSDGGSCPATPNFKGRICKISTPLTLDSGYYRVFEGKLLTEILQKRIKPAKYWVDTEIDDIIAEIISDLSLGSDIDVDTTAVTIYSEDDSYLDLIRKLSDMWVSAGSQVKKDFYVDAGDVGHPNGHLVWKTRPLRVSSENLTVGTNIITYNVLRDKDSVRNSITAYGYQGKIGVPGQDGRCEPSDKDAWTEPDPPVGWTVVHGTLTSQSATPKVGSYNLCGVGELTGGNKIMHFYRSGLGLTEFGKKAYNTLNFYEEVRLYAPDASNYFYKAFNPTGSWVFRQYQLGQNQEYNVDTNPTGAWSKIGSPLWNNIDAVCFYYFKSGNNSFTIYLDGLYFGHGRFRYTASSAPSITAYEQQDMQIVDDSLISDANCATRAETLLYQLKDAPTRIDIETTGNTNLLIGDQLTLSIPAEGITAQPYDVLSVEHDFTKVGLKTKVSVVNSNVTPTLINIRQLPSGTPYEAISKQFDIQREIAKGLQKIR